VKEDYKEEEERMIRKYGVSQQQEKRQSEKSTKEDKMSM